MEGFQEYDVNIGGRNYKMTSGDDYLARMGDGFEPEMVALFQTVASGSKVILDIGANVGCTSLLFATLAEKVYSFEPNPVTFSHLRGNIERAEYKNIVLQQIGLGSEPGELAIRWMADNHAGGFISGEDELHGHFRSEKIPVHTLDDVVASLNPPAIDFIKIDVEGFEGHVLRGATNTLRKYRPTVLLELNHWCLNVFQRTTVPDFLDMLRSKFPVLLAVHNHTFLDLHDDLERYTVMHDHICCWRYLNLIGGYPENQRLHQLKSKFQHTRYEAA